MISWAIKHPVLTVLAVWGVNAAVRSLVSSATGYDSLQILIDGVNAKAKADQAKAKVKA